MKFAILHVDQSIELILKEKVRKGGKSIYKNPKETISIWEAYRVLEIDLGCTIPEKPDLELIHEERNTIQHKYANPNPEDTAFHIENAMKFLVRFTAEELDIDLRDFIPSDFIEKIIPP